MDQKISELAEVVALLDGDSLPFIRAGANYRILAENLMPIDAAAGVGSLRTLGTGALQAAAGDDSRLFNARSPTAHAATHAAGGSDPLEFDFIAGGVFNVRDPDFGAPLDGIADDAPGIRAAIAAAVAAGGGVVVVPQSDIDYVIASAVTIPAGVRLLCSGMDATAFRRKAGFTGYLFLCYGTMEGGYTIDGAYTGKVFTRVGTTSVMTAAGNTFANDDEVMVFTHSVPGITGAALPAPLAAATSYFIRDKSGDTFKLSATLGGAAITLTSSGVGHNIIHLLTSSFGGAAVGVRGWNAKVREAKVMRTWHIGIDAPDSTDALIEDCILTGSGITTESSYGVWAAVSSCTNLTVRHCTINNWSVSAVYGGGENVIIDGCNFFGNHVQFFPTGGGQVANGAAGHLTVKNTQIGTGGGVVTNGIEVDNGRWTVDNVTIVNQAQWGFYLQGGTAHKFTNVNVSSCGTNFGSAIAATAWVGMNNTPAEMNSVNIVGNSVGVGFSTTPAATLQLRALTEQLRLDYDAAHFTSFTVSSPGNLTIAPSGGTLSLTGNLNISGLTSTRVVFTDSSKNLVSSGTVAADQGGTGLSSYAVGDLLYASASNALSKLAAVAVGSVVVSGGVATAPAWSATPQLSRLGLGSAADSVALLKLGGVSPKLYLADSTGSLGITMSMGNTAGFIGWSGNRDFITGTIFDAAKAVATYYMNVANGDSYHVWMTGSTNNANATERMRLTKLGDLISGTYISQTTGWAITATGSADFRYVYVDELHAKSFIADLEQALAGGQIIAKSVAELALDFTLPAAGGAGTLTLKDLPSAAAMAVFQSGDIVRLRQFTRASGSLTIADAWGVVTSFSSLGNGTQTWTFTRSSGGLAGTASGTILKSTLALDYGTTGNGVYEVNAIDGAYGINSPYSQIITWTAHPQNGQLVRTRLGNLKGVTTVTEFGLYAGDGGVGAANKFLRISDLNFEIHNVGLSIFDSVTKVIELNQAGPYFALGNPMPAAYLQASTSGIWMGKVSSTYNFRVGTTSSGGALTAGISWDGSLLSVIGSLALGSTPPTSPTAGTGVFENATGIFGLQANKQTFALSATDGTLKLGSDLSAAATTAFVVAGTAITYNSESLGVGDVLMGDNSSGKANVHWKKSTGILEFRGGTTVQAYVDTTGSIVAGAGTVVMSATGVLIQQSTGLAALKFISGTTSGELNFFQGSANLASWGDATHNGSTILTAKNIFSSPTAQISFSIITTPANLAAAFITAIDPATSTMNDGISISRQSTGTPVAGFGNSILLSFSSATSGSARDAARIGALWTTATDASRASAIVFQTVTAAGALAERVRIGVGLMVGSPTGGDKGTGTANFAADIYKNNLAYTNPDYVLEHWAEGWISKYINKPGAAAYRGLQPIAELKKFIKTNYHLPRFGQDVGHGLFSGGDGLLASLEEAYCYLFELEERILNLERRLAA